MIQLQLQNEQFEPGQEIAGEVIWSGLNVDDRIEVRLVWYTSGKGTRDIEVVSVLPLSLPLASSQGEGREQFSLNAPTYPFSFSGKLISIVWAVEGVIMPGGDAATTPIMIGPGAAEVVVVAKHPLDD